MNDCAPSLSFEKEAWSNLKMDSDLYSLSLSTGP